MQNNFTGIHVKTVYQAWPGLPIWDLHTFVTTFAVGENQAEIRHLIWRN